MIKLKLTVKEFKALSAYLQVCITILRQEINSGGELMLIREQEQLNSTVILWDTGSREGNIMKVAIRNAQIALFEKLQLRLINLSVRNSKTRSMGIQKIEGALILEFMHRAIPIAANNYITLVIRDICAPVILKNLI